MEPEEPVEWPDAAQLEANCRQIISTLTLSTDHGVAAFAADWLTSQGAPPDPQVHETGDGDDPAPASMWCLVRVLYDFPSLDAGDFEPQPENLSIQTGDLVAVQYTGRRGWWYGRVILDKDNKVKPHGRAGWFPSAYAVPTELDRNQSDAIPLGLVNAIEPFSEDVTGMTHDTGDSSSGRLLSFQKGEIIAVWEEGNGGWLLGSVVMNEQGTLEPVNPRGWFPASVTVHFPPDHLLLHSMVENPRENYEQLVDNLPMHASLRSGASSPPLKFSRSASAPPRSSSQDRSPSGLPVSAENTPRSINRHNLSNYVIDESEDQVEQLSRIYDALIDTIHAFLDQGKTDIEILQDEELDGSGIAAMDVMALRRAAGRRHTVWISIRWRKLSDKAFSAYRHRLRKTFTHVGRSNGRATGIQESSAVEPKTSARPGDGSPSSAVTERRLPGVEAPVYLTLNYADGQSPETEARGGGAPVSAWASRKIEDMCEAIGVSPDRIHLVDCVPGVRITIQVDADDPSRESIASRQVRSHPRRVAGESASEVAEKIRHYSVAHPSSSGIHRVAVSGKASGRSPPRAKGLEPTVGVQLETIGLYATADAAADSLRSPQQARWWSSPQQSRHTPTTASAVAASSPGDDGEREMRILVKVVKAVGLPLRDAMGGMLDCPYVSLTVEEAPGQSGMTVCTPNARRVREPHQRLQGPEGEMLDTTAEVDSAVWDCEFMLGVPHWRASRARVAVDICNWNHTGADALVGEVVDPRLSVRRILEAEELDGWFVLLAPDHHGPILSPPPARSPCLLHMKFFRAPDSLDGSRSQTRSPPARRSITLSPAPSTDAQTQTPAKTRDTDLPPPISLSPRSRQHHAPAATPAGASNAEPQVDELKLSVREWVLYPSVRPDGVIGDGAREDSGRQDVRYGSGRGVRFSPPAGTSSWGWADESEFKGNVMGSVIGRTAGRVAELKSRNMEGRHREREAVVETLKEQRRRARAAEERAGGELPTRESFLEVLGQARDQIQKILTRSGSRDASPSRSASPQRSRSPAHRNWLGPEAPRSGGQSGVLYDDAAVADESSAGRAPRHERDRSVSDQKAAEVMMVVEANGAVGETLTDTPLQGGVGFVDTHGYRGGYDWVGDGEVETSWLKQACAEPLAAENGASDIPTINANSAAPWQRPSAPAFSKTALASKVLRLRRDVPLPMARAPSNSSIVETVPAAPPPPPPFAPPPVNRPDVRRRAWDMWVPGQDGDVIGKVSQPSPLGISAPAHSSALRRPGESAPLPLPDYSEVELPVLARTEGGREPESERGRRPTRELKYDSWGEKEPKETEPEEEEEDLHSKSIMRGLC